MQPSDRNNAGYLLSKHSPQKVNKPCVPKSNNQSKEHHQHETTTFYKKTIVQFLGIKTIFTGLMAWKPRGCSISYQLGRQSNKSPTSPTGQEANNSHSSSSASAENRCKHHQQQNHRHKRQEFRLQPLAAQMPPTIRGTTIKKNTNGLH